MKNGKMSSRAMQMMCDYQNEGHDDNVGKSEKLTREFADEGAAQVSPDCSDFALNQASR
jgi:hypothetical protein